MVLATCTSNFSNDVLPHRQQFSPSQYSASSLSFYFKLMHFSFKDLSLGPSWVLWKVCWRRSLGNVNTFAAFTFAQSYITLVLCPLLFKKRFFFYINMLCFFVLFISNSINILLFYISTPFLKKRYHIVI